MLTTSFPSFISYVHVMNMENPYSFLLLTGIHPQCELFNRIDGYWQEHREKKETTEGQRNKSAKPRNSRKI